MVQTQACMLTRNIYNWCSFFQIMLLNLRPHCELFIVGHPSLNVHFIQAAFHRCQESPNEIHIDQVGHGLHSTNLRRVQDSEENEGGLLQSY